MRTLPRRQIVPVILAFAFMLPAGARLSKAAEPQRAAIHVVACDEKVASSKRGVCANALSADDYRALAPGVSWYYNWNYEPMSSPPAGVTMDFLPMAWGDRPADLSGLQSYLSRLQKMPRAILAINEPNLRGQAFIPPEETAVLYRKIKAIADEHHVPVVGPNMALGSGHDASITAMDPIEKKDMTYTFMIPFLKAFLFYEGNTEVPALGIHTYGALGELQWAVEETYKDFQKPVWVTEYAQWKSDNVEAARVYLMQATDFLERSPHVAGYAWFKERADKNPVITLLEPASGKLSPLGEAYVRMPAHDANLYYRIPGRLEAGKYAAAENMEIHPTTDSNGFAFMGSTAAGGWLDYHLQVDVPGTYQLKFRTGGAAGSFQILQGEAVQAQVQPVAQPGWQTVETSVQLAAGAQTLRVRYENINQALHWIEFTR
jgi:hypothetical protein